MIVVKLTNGFGNNLFQYNAAKLLAEFHQTHVFAIPPHSDYYAIQDLKKLGVCFYEGYPAPVNTVQVNDNNYKNAFNEKYTNNDFILSGYFEDYKYFKDEINLIKSWYPDIKENNTKDLVIHFRAGDRLFYKNESMSKPSAAGYVAAIEQFDFEKLHIVTDMPQWEKVTKESLSQMTFHMDVPTQNRVSLEESVRYFNSFIEAFEKYNPIMTKRSVGEDFEFIRSFTNILFQHGTLGWWAAALSEARKVGVYGPWRPWKGASNKNLSNVGFEGWFKWQ
jgi:hypothetical protein